MGTTALWMASHNGHLSTVRYLIEVGNADMMIGDSLVRKTITCLFLVWLIVFGLEWFQLFVYCNYAWTFECCSILSRTTTYESSSTVEGS